MFLFAAAGVLAGAWSAQPQKPAFFPPLTGYSLDKQKISLPEGMAGQTDLLILSFAPEQQKDVQSWLPVAQGLQHTNFQFHYYQLPIFGQENFIFRWWETSSLRSDDSDPESWHWTVPLFIDRHKLLRDLDIPNDKQIAVVLADRQGHILWHAIGPMSQDKRASLLAAVPH